jgi:hypothetical protein
MNGVWQGPYVPDMSRNGRGQQGHPDLPFTDAGRRDWDTYDAANGDYTGSCLPFGFTRSMNAPNPFQIVQDGGLVVFLFEVGNWFHVVAADRRGHPPEISPTWYGHSIGRWDGDTLVVDTVGFNGYTRLDTVGHPHSDALHLVQTFRLTDADHIAYTVTVDDPRFYTRPWTNQRVLTRQKGDLIEYSCEENNKDLREGHIKAWTLPPNPPAAFRIARPSSEAPPPPAAPADRRLRRPDGSPDLSGVWQRPYVPDMSTHGRGPALGYAEPPFSPDDTAERRESLRRQGHHRDLPLTPAGLEDWKTYDPADGDYTGSCLPFGLSRSINSPLPLQIVQTEQYIALLFEQNTWFHVVAIDGRGHPKALEPTWFGHSVGRWDDDTLVVDTVGFNGHTRLDTVGHPHSPALHMVQTFRRTDANHLAYSVTIDDPKAYTKPWTNERTFTRLDGDLLEYSCEENNRDLREGRIKLWTPPVKGRYE